MGGPSGSWVVDPNSILIVLVHNVKAAMPTRVSVPFWGSLGDLLWDACVVFRVGVDCFEMERRACCFGVGGAVPP